MKIDKILVIVAFASAPAMELAAADASVYIRRGLVAQYDGIDNAGLGLHDNAATSWCDLSGNGLHAAKNARTDIVWFDKGWTYLNATLVNGVMPFVLPDSSPVNVAVNSKTFSVDFAVSPADYPAGNTRCYVYLGNVSNTYKGLILEQNATIIPTQVCAWRDNTPYVSSSFAVAAGDQLTIAFTSTPASHVFYRNGAFGSESTAQDGMSVTTAGFVIGGDRNPTRDFTYRGSYHAVRFYSCKLTADEVKINAALDAVRFFGKSIAEANADMPAGWRLVEGPYLQCERSGDFTYDGKDNLVEEDRQVLTGSVQTLSILADGTTLPPAIVLKAGLSVAGRLKIALPTLIDNGTYVLIDASGEAGIELADGAAIELAEGSSEVAGQARRLTIEDGRVVLDVETIVEPVVIDDGLVHEYTTPISRDEIPSFRLVSGTLRAGAENVMLDDVVLAFMGGSYAPFGPKFTARLDGTAGNMAFVAGCPIGLSAISRDLAVVAGDDEELAVSLGGDLPSTLLLNDVGADHRLTVSNAVSFAGAGGVEVRSAEAGADVVFAKKLSSTGNFDKTGAGTLRLRQGQTAQTVAVQKGTVIYGGDGDETSTLAELWSGATDADAARVAIESGSIAVGGNVFATRAGTIDQSGGNVTLGGFLHIGYEGTGGVYNFTGGTMAIPSTKYYEVNIGNKAGSHGVFNIGGNAELNDMGNLQVGLSGSGVLNQSGGTVAVGGCLSIGRWAGANGVCNLTGGLLRSDRVLVGEEGTGTMNISGTGCVETAKPLVIGYTSTASGEVNLFDGGRIVAPSVGAVAAAKCSRLNVDGGVIAAYGSGQTLTDFLTVPFLKVGPKGMTIDTGDNDVSVGEAFLAMTAEGPVVKSGTGVLTVPAASPAPVKVLQGTLQLADGELPVGADYLGESALLHRWSFNGDARDSVGGKPGELQGAASWDDEANPRAVVLSGGKYGTSCVNLGANLLPAEPCAIMVEIWGTVHAPQNYSRVFSIGTGVNDQFTITWCAGFDTTKMVPYLVKGGRTIFSSTVSTGELKSRRLYITLAAAPQANGTSHIGWTVRDLDTWEQLAGWYGPTTAAWTPANVASGEMLLGRSHNSLDGDASATYDEVRIWKGLLPAAQLARSAWLGPDALPTVPSEKKFPEIDVAAGAAVSIGANSVTAGTVRGSGTLAGSGSLAVEKLDVAADAIGTLAVNVPLAVEEWLLDVAPGGACDRIEGDCALDASRLVISMRSPGKLAGSYTIADVGSVAGSPKLAEGLKGWRLTVEDGRRIVLSSEGMSIFIR